MSYLTDMLRANLSRLHFECIAAGLALHGLNICDIRQLQRVERREFLSVIFALYINVKMVTADKIPTDGRSEKTTAIGTSGGEPFRSRREHLSSTQRKEAGLLTIMLHHVSGHQALHVLDSKLL